MSNFPSNEKALGMYRKMYQIRKYEESIYYLFLEGIMPGTIHQSTGEEASAVGMLYDLRKDDWMASTHRPAGHDIAKGISVKAMMCEMFGKAEGCCGGKGGAMHTGDISLGVIPANAIVGDMDARYEAYADAEKYMIEHALVIPWYKNVLWQVTHVNDYSKIYAPYGIQGDKFKNWETSVDAYTTEDYAKLAEAYAAGTAK